jgi:hypothetical protein
MSSTQEVSTILEDNLFQVFGEANHDKRLAALAKLWTADSDCLFIDPMGVFRTHNDISTFIGKLQEKHDGKIFTVRSTWFWFCSETSLLIYHYLSGSAQILFYGDDDSLRVARLSWTYGLPGQVPEITGEDVATVVSGKIQRMYTFIDQ